MIASYMFCFVNAAYCIASPNTLQYSAKVSWGKFWEMKPTWNSDEQSFDKQSIGSKEES